MSRWLEEAVRRRGATLISPTKRKANLSAAHSSALFSFSSFPLSFFLSFLLLLIPLSLSFCVSLVLLLLLHEQARSPIPLSSRSTTSSPAGHRRSSAPTSISGRSSRVLSRYHVPRTRFSVRGLSSNRASFRKPWETWKSFWKFLSKRISYLDMFEAFQSLDLLDLYREIKGLLDREEMLML